MRLEEINYDVITMTIVTMTTATLTSLWNEHCHTSYTEAALLSVKDIVRSLHVHMSV